jgi:dethiobiotin synthetase
VKGLFVTGTDTGVGKTYASVALIQGWRGRGLRVGVMKPTETGLERDGEWGPPDDAVKLLEASGASLTLDEVCPYRYGAPMAPAEAARLEGAPEPSFERIMAIYESIAADHDIMLLEGAGGLLVPFAGTDTAADLVKALDVPVVIVARIGLGTINHTCLTVEAARNRGLEIVGVIFTRAEDPAQYPPGPDEACNPDAVARQAGVRIIANLPFDSRIPSLDLSL